MFALHPSAKVFSQVFFKKLAGLGRAHKKTAFSFCQAFSLRLSCQRKSGIVRFYVFMRGRIIYYYFVRSNVILQKVQHVILSGENDTVCHFRSRTRPKGGREAGSIMSKHLFRPRSQIMLCII